MDRSSDSGGVRSDIFENLRFLVIVIVECGRNDACLAMNITGSVCQYMEVDTNGLDPESVTLAPYFVKERSLPGKLRGTIII